MRIDDRAHTAGLRIHDDDRAVAIRERRRGCVLQRRIYFRFIRSGVGPIADGNRFVVRATENKNQNRRARKQEQQLHAVASVGCATGVGKTSCDKPGTVRASAVNVHTQPIKLNRNDSSSRRTKTANSLLLPLTVNVGTRMTYGNTKKTTSPSP